MKCFHTILIITFLLTLNSCYQCRTYYTIQEVTSDSSAKMSVSGGGIDGPFSPEIKYLLDHNYIIENLNVVFLDKKKDTIKYASEYWYQSDDSIGVTEHFENIKQRFRIAKSERNYTTFGVRAEIQNELFSFVVFTDIKDSNGVLYKCINRFNVTSKRNCSFHFAMH